MIFNLVFTSWLSPSHRWTVPAPARICAADPWCCAFGPGRPPARRSACSSESTAAAVCPGTTVDWTGWGPTGRIDRSFSTSSRSRAEDQHHPSFSAPLVSLVSRERLKGVTYIRQTISWISSECVWPTSAVTAATQLQPNTQHTASEHTADVYPHFFLFVCVFLSEKCQGFLTCSVKYKGILKIYLSKICQPVLQLTDISSTSCWFIIPGHLLNCVFKNLRLSSAAVCKSNSAWLVLLSVVVLKKLTAS